MPWILCHGKPGQRRSASSPSRTAASLISRARAALIDSLVDSLDDGIDEGAEEAWKEEIGRRLQQIDSGAVELIEWEAASRRLRGRFGQ